MRTTKSEEIELKLIAKDFVSASMVIFSALFLGIGMAWFSESAIISVVLWGAILGTLAASINLIALAYAVKCFMGDARKRMPILWPLVSFVAIGVVVFFARTSSWNFLMGFAAGLASPLLYATFLTRRVSYPA